MHYPDRVPQIWTGLDPRSFSTCSIFWVIARHVELCALALCEVSFITLFSLHLPNQRFFDCYNRWRYKDFSYQLMPWCVLNPRQYSCTVTRDLLKDALPTELQHRGKAYYAFNLGSPFLTKRSFTV